MDKKTRAKLQKAWKQRCKFRTDGDALFEQGEELCRKGNETFKKGREFWEKKVKELCGDITIQDYGKGCFIDGEIFGSAPWDKIKAVPKIVRYADGGCYIDGEFFTKRR